MIPREAAPSVDYHLGLETTGVVEANRADKEHFSHSRVQGIDRRAAYRAEGPGDNVPTVRRFVPLRSFARQLDGCFRERHLRRMARTAGTLTVAALAVSRHHRFCRDLISNCSAIACATVAR